MEEDNLKCLKCDRIFKTKSGLSLHLKKCGTIVPTEIEVVTKPHDGPYNYVGDPSQNEDKPKGIFELIVDEFVQAINPNSYFITSGEAVAKAEVLERDLWRMAGQARQFVKILKQTRGEAVRLECGWGGNGMLIVRHKNPRLRLPATIKDVTVV